MPDGERRRRRHPLGKRRARGTIRHGRCDVAEWVDSRGGSLRGRSTDRLGRRRARRLQRAMPHLDHQRAHRGGRDPRRGDLHDVGLGRPRRRHRDGAGAVGQRLGAHRLCGPRSDHHPHGVRLDHDPPAQRCAPGGARRRGTASCATASRRATTWSSTLPTSAAASSSSRPDAGATSALAGRGHHCLHRSRWLHGVHRDTRRRRSAAAPGNAGPRRARCAPRRRADRQGARRRIAALVPRPGHRAAHGVHRQRRPRGGVIGDRPSAVDPGRHAPRHGPPARCRPHRSRRQRGGEDRRCRRSRGRARFRHSPRRRRAGHRAVQRARSGRDEGVPGPIRLWRADSC